jgi:DNA-binding transcriptional regulator YdaS (Cro superfamily)
MLTQTMQEALSRAIEIVGGPTAMGRLLGISSQAVSQWERVPVPRVIEVERATLDPQTQQPRVTRHELRPDIYPAEEDDLAPA